MNPKVMDAVGLIGRYVADNWESLVDHGELNDELLERGFSSREILEAFRWIERHTLGAAEGKPIKPAKGVRPSLRLLSTSEQMKLTPEAYGLLTSYHQRGLIDSVTLEDILDRIQQSPVEDVGEAEVRRLTALALFNEVQHEWRGFLRSTNTLVH